MLKRLWLLAGLLSLVTSSAFGAGTVPGFNLTPQFDLSGKVAPGCKLYVIQAGTTSTPQNAYQDTALTQVLPNPLTCDAAARLPQWFVADGTIKLRLTKSDGTQIFVGDSLLVVGPSSGGGGGGGTVDPTTVLATGDFKLVYNTGVLSGFVRCNGRTIGSATSGATERANADTSALYAFLWGADANLAVSGGRGVSAAADFAANKALTLPDCRGRGLAGLDDMGNSAAGNLTSTYFGTSATALGALGGSQSHTLTASESAVLNYNFTPPTQTNPASASNNITYAGGSNNLINIWAGSGTPLPTVGGSISTNAGGNAHSIVQPTMLTTIYIKL